MRRSCASFCWFLALMVQSLLSVPAASARPIEFSGTLTIELFFPFGPPSRVVFVADGQGVAEVSVGGGVRTGVSLPASAFVATTSMAITDALLAPVSAQALTLVNEAGSFLRSGGTTTSPSRIGGSMPLRGVARLCLFSTSCASAPTVVALPITPIGSGGARTGTSPVIFTLSGQPWTTGAVFVPGQGFFSGTSTANRLSLVTPVLISTSGLPGDLAFVPGLGRLQLEFVEPIPEPHTLLLTAGGLAALAGAARRRS